MLRCSILTVTRCAGTERLAKWRQRSYDPIQAMAKPRADRPSPTGTITFLFTDIEGSTRAWQAQRAAMQRAVARHDELIRQCVVARDGDVFKTVGDAFCTAFRPRRRCSLPPWRPSRR